MALADMLECYICTEKYDNKQRIPKAVPCQHTICQLCLKQNDRNEPLLTCPTCREPFQGDMKDCLLTKKLMDIAVKEKAREPSVPVRDIQQMEMSIGSAESHNPNRTSSLRNTRHGRPGDGNLLTRSAQGSDRVLRMGDRKITVKHIDKVPTSFS